MIIFKRYLVMHDYGPGEGWKIIAACDTMLEAVYARDDDLRNGGGTNMIVEWHHPLDAYDRANYERQHERRKAEAQRAC